MKAINRMLGRTEKPKPEGSRSSSSVVGSTISVDDINIIDKQYSVENRNKEGLYSPSTPTKHRSITKGNNKGNVDRLIALNENDRKILASKKQAVFLKKKRGECLLQKGDAVTKMYVVLSGLVMVFRSGMNYADYSIGPGDLFGDECFTGVKSLKTFRAANDVDYMEVEKDFFMSSLLFSSFTEQMNDSLPSVRNKNRKESVTTDPESVTATDSSRNTDRGFSPDGMSEPDGIEDGTTSSVFFGPISNICTFGATTPKSAGRTKEHGYGSPHPIPLELTPKTKNAQTDSPWCVIPDIFTWNWTTS